MFRHAEAGEGSPLVQGRFVTGFANTEINRNKMYVQLKGQTE